MIMPADIQTLEKLYFDGTKHSIYQNIPSFVQQALGYSVQIDEKWRGDSARWKNLLQEIDFSQIKVVGDIGANTGFFALSLAHRFPRLRVYAYEANPNHHRFILAIKEQFRLKNVQVKNSFIDLKGCTQIEKHDYLLNFNVLHHAGVDFDKGLVTPQNFCDYAVGYLRCLTQKTEKMVFQMGFNWGGNKQKPLVPLRDDPEKVLFMSRIFKQAGWRIEKIFSVRFAGKLTYYELPAELTLRINADPQACKNQLQKYYQNYPFSTFSEFYRRPIFYCVSDTFRNKDQGKAEI